MIKAMSRQDAEQLLRRWNYASDWVRTNDHVVQVAIEQCHRWIDEGHGERWGVSGLIERLRWILRVRTAESRPTLNNSIKPYLARWIAWQEIRFVDLFEDRQCGASRADDWLVWQITGELPADVRRALALSVVMLDVPDSDDVVIVALAAA